MKKLILALLSASLLALGTYADKKKEAAADKPAKSEKADKAKKKAAKKSAGKEMCLTGELKCAHCDVKIGDACASVLKTEKGLYFLKGKIAKAFAKANPKVTLAQVNGTAKKQGEHFSLKVTKIIGKKPPAGK